MSEGRHFYFWMLEEFYQICLVVHTLYGSRELCIWCHSHNWAVLHSIACPELLCSMFLMLKIPHSSCFLLPYIWNDCMTQHLPPCMSQRLPPFLHTLLSCAMQPFPFCQNHWHFSFSLRGVSHSGVSSWRESTLNIQQGAV